jgi:site-specific DNA recombinase
VEDTAASRQTDRRRQAVLTRPSVPDLANAIYAGRIVHKGQVHPGQHPAIVDEATWQTVQDRLRSNAQVYGERSDAAEPSLLAGLLFDGQERRLHPTHATKRGKRYRYYYVRAVAEGSRADAGGSQALRLPAPALESAVIGALQALLRDDGRLLPLMPGIDAATARFRIEEARSLADRLQATTSVQAVTIKTLIDRIVVHDDRLVLSVRSEPLWGGEASSKDEPMLLEVPVVLKRCGGAVRLIVRGAEGNKPRQPNARLVTLLSKAQAWFKALCSGEHASVVSLAKALRIASAEVTNVIYLAFMAPDLVQRIVEGDHPQWLGTKRLLAMAPLPLDWREQRRALGMDAPLTV